MQVWVLQHVVRAEQPDEDVKLVGVYSSEDAGRAAIDRLLSQPGFGGGDGQFSLEPYDVDKDHWTEGFVSK